MMKKLSIALCLLLSMPALPARAAVHIDAKGEREAAVKAERAANWDAALLHYENIYDSTPTTAEEQVELRRKFAQLRPKVKPNADPCKAGVYKVRSFVFRTIAVGSVNNTYTERQIRDLNKANAAWSDEVRKASLGNCRLAAETVVIDAPLKQFHGCPDVYTGLPYFTAMKPGDADHVTAYALSKGLPCNCWASTMGSVCKGATYAGFNDAGDGATGGNGEVQVHEWLHAIQMTLEWHQIYPAGIVPNPDSGGNCGPKCWQRKEGEEGWYPWYRHILAVHITRKMWRELSLTRAADNAWLEPLQLCPTFLTLGPFNGKGKDKYSGLGVAFIDESNSKPELSKQDGGKTWCKSVRAGAFLNLLGVYYPSEHQVAYGAVVAKSPKAQTAQVRIGSAAGCKLWHNGKLILTNTEQRPCGRDQNNVEIKLQKGDNQFLLKVVNFGARNWADWGMNLRITDSAGKPLENIEYALPGKKPSSRLPQPKSVKPQGS